MFYVNQGGAWVPITLHVNNAGAWTDDNDNIYALDAGVWKLIQPVGGGGGGGDTTVFEAPQNVQTTSVSDNGAAFSWTNPTNDPVPSEIQWRIPEITDVWDVLEYPSTTTAHLALQPETTYTFQVRYTHRTDGTIDLYSALSEIQFTTVETSVPTGPVSAGPGGGGGGNSVFTFPPLGGTPGAVDSAGCWWEWRIEVWSDGTWQAVVPPIGGEYDGTETEGLYDISTLDPGTYHYSVREVCNGTPEDWQDGSPFSPISDYDDLCAAADDSFDQTDIATYADAVFYLPKICGTEIHEAITDTVFTKGAGYSGIFGTDETETNWQLGSLLEYSDFASSKSVAQGTLDAIAALAPGDFTLGFGIRIVSGPIDSDVLLWSLGGNRISLWAHADGAGYRIGAQAFLTGGALLDLESSTVLDYDTDYRVFLRWDDSGDKELFVGSTMEDSDTSGATLNAALTGETIIYLPQDARIWGIAGWDRALSDSEVETISPPEAIEFIAQTSVSGAGTLLLGLPSGIEHGDVILVHTSCDANNAGETNVTIPGFERAAYSDSSVVCAQLHWKAALGNESSTSIEVQFAGGSSRKAVASVWRNCQPLAPIDIAQSSRQGGAGTVHAITTTPVVSQGGREITFLAKYAAATGYTATSSPLEYDFALGTRLSAMGKATEASQGASAANSVSTALSEQVIAISVRLRHRNESVIRFVGRGNGENSNGATMSIVFPANVRENDLCLIAYEDSVNVAAPAAPSGWTQIEAVNVAGRRMGVYSKLYAASDGTFVSFTNGQAGTFHLGQCVAFRNALGVADSNISTSNSPATMPSSNDVDGGVHVDLVGTMADSATVTGAVKEVQFAGATGSGAAKSFAWLWRTAVASGASVGEALTISAGTPALIASVSLTPDPAAVLPTADDVETLLSAMTAWWDVPQYSGSGALTNRGAGGASLNLDTGTFPTKTGNYLPFNGTTHGIATTPGDLTTTPLPIGLTQDFTIGVILETDATPNAGGFYFTLLDSTIGQISILDSGTRAFTGYLLGHNGGGPIRANGTSATVKSLVLIRKSGANFSTEVNGVVVSGADGRTVPNDGAGAVQIGAQNGTSRQEFRLYGAFIALSSLSGADIAAIRAYYGI